MHGQPPGVLGVGQPGRAGPEALQHGRCVQGVPALLIGARPLPRGGRGQRGFPGIAARGHGLLGCGDGHRVLAAPAAHFSGPG